MQPISTRKTHKTQSNLSLQAAEISQKNQLKNPLRSCTFFKNRQENYS